MGGRLRLTKQDHETHEVKQWGQQDVDRELPWQPVFVPEPYSDKEDAGVLLSFVRDQPTGDNFCVVIDAETFDEQARIHFPKGHHIPLHGHGTFFAGTVLSWGSELVWLSEPVRLRFLFFRKASQFESVRWVVFFLTLSTCQLSAELAGTGQ